MQRNSPGAARDGGPVVLHPFRATPYIIHFGFGKHSRYVVMYISTVLHDVSSRHKPLVESLCMFNIISFHVSNIVFLLTA